MPKSGNAADRDVKMDDKYGPTSPAKKTLGVRGLGGGLGGMRRLVAVGVSVGRIVGGWENSWWEKSSWEKSWWENSSWENSW